MEIRVYDNAAQAGQAAAALFAAQLTRKPDSVLGLAPRQENSQEEEPFSDELLVMAGLSSRQMNQLLQGFRRKKIPPVELKAVLTAANGGWNAFQLCRELRLEHQAMLRGENLHEGGAL